MWMADLHMVVFMVHRVSALALTHAVGSVIMFGLHTDSKNMYARTL